MDCLPSEYESFLTFDYKKVFELGQDQMYLAKKRKKIRFKVPHYRYILDSIFTSTILIWVQSDQCRFHLSLGENMILFLRFHGKNLPHKKSDVSFENNYFITN